jgi:hypothetical protein
MTIYPTLEERLLKNSILDPESDCWLWMRRNTNRYGRICMRVNGKSTSFWAHRIAYEEWRGPIPKGMTVEHTCYVTVCINPGHLILLDNAANARARWKRSKF